MPELPSISVIIATFNRCGVLRRTIEKFSAQDIGGRDYEIIVVDDGSSDDTPEMVRAMIGSTSCALKYLSHENRGPGFTQNRGIREARGRLVLLVADDIWSCAGMLAQHLMMHDEYPGVQFAVLGNVIQSPALPPTVMHKHWDPFQYKRFDGKTELDGIHFLACNISVKRQFLVEKGMFRERKGAAHEDIELGYRLRQGGLRIVFSEDALGHHHHAETLTRACQRAYERGLNFDMLTDNIPASFILPLYHICSPEAGVNAFVRMLPRELVRRFLFNKWTVPHVWTPVLQRAETSRLASILACGMSYRGTIHYHQRLGFDQLRTEKRRLCSADTVSSASAHERR